MRIKRICALLMAAAIGAGACSVPAFAFTGETTEAESTGVVYADAVAPDIEESDVPDENNDAAETDTETESDGIDLSGLRLPAIPGLDTDFYADLLENLDPEVVEVLLKNPKLLAYFLPTLHVTVTDTSVIIAVDGDEKEAAVNQTGTVKTNGSNLNVRTGPGIGYDIISSLANGSEIEITGEENGWYQIVFPSKYAYVCGQYVELNAVSTTPAPEGYSFDIDGEMLADFLSAFSYLFEDEPQVIQETHGLTPSGNLTLIDDIGPVSGEGQQFVTLVSKAGNYFYLIIDRDEKGNENVHFLNQVDEADLFALMDEDEAAALKEQLAAEEAEKQQAEQPAITPTEPAETDKETEPQAQQKSKLPYAVGLIVLLGACGAGGAFFLMKNKKQSTVNDHPDPDADYREDDDGYDIPEEAEDEEDYDESEDY